MNVETLKDWIPIGAAVASVLISLILAVFTYKVFKQNKELTEKGINAQASLAKDGLKEQARIAEEGLKSQMLIESERVEREKEKINKNNFLKSISEFYKSINKFWKIIETKEPQKIKVGFWEWYNNFAYLFISLESTKFIMKENKRVIKIEKIGLPSQGIEIFINQVHEKIHEVKRLVLEEGFIENYFTKYKFKMNDIMWPFFTKYGRMFSMSIEKNAAYKGNLSKGEVNAKINK